MHRINLKRTPKSLHARRLSVEALESRQLLALSVTTIPATDITLRTATIGLEVEGDDPAVVLYWGDEDGGTDDGAWDHEVNLKDVSTIDLTDLEVDTTYYYRGFALSIGTFESAWSDTASFRTLPPTTPQVAADPVSIVGGTTARVAGRVLDTGGDTPTVNVYYGLSDGGDRPEDWDSSTIVGEFDGDFTTTLTQLSTDKTYSYRVAAENAAGTVWTPTGTFKTVDIPNLRISEFMASNGETLVSRVRGTVDGDFPRTVKPYDWIEIQNSSDQPMDIGGYHLTDDRQLPLKWQFPAGTIVPAGETLVVFASGLNVLDTNLDEQGHLHTNFQLASNGEYLALTDPSGSVVHEYRGVPDQHRDVSYGMFGQDVGTFNAPTPGQVNGPLAPLIEDVRHEFVTPGDANSEIVVSARVQATTLALQDVVLHYRVMYEEELTVAMVDDGTGADAAASDGIFTATIPGGIAEPGQMIRYSVTADSASGLQGRAPSFVDEDASPEYYGTLIEDAELTSTLPILHWFIEDPRRVNSARGTRASVAYDGEFYDNVFVRIRGGTARSWPKKSYKIEFNDDHHLRFRADVPRVDEFNLNATYTDKTYLRARLTAEFQLDSGTPSPETFHLRVQQNNEFFSVAFFVEQPDRDFLRRHGMDPEGSLYKAGPGSTYTSLAGFEKKTREDEGRDDISEFVQGLRLRGDDLERFLFDNADLPAQINFMATNIISQNIDASDKNHYVYRDTNGTGEWRMLPWDLDLVFGPDALNTDMIVSDENTRGAVYPNAVHPFLGSRAKPLHAGKINMFLDGMITNERTQEMLLRRVRTMADEFLADGYFHRRIDQLVELLKDEVPQDRAKWRNSAHFPGATRPYDAEADRVRTEYLDRRLPYLTQYHVEGGVGIPLSQPMDATLEFGETVVFNPTSGNQLEEYFTITNPNDYAVDVSGWTISGATSTTMKPGTVIPAGDVLYLVSNVPAFRARSDGPSGNQGLFVQQYVTELPDTGGTLELLDRSGRSIDATTFGAGAVPASADNLRISEINYNPHDGLPQFGEMLAGGANFEFVELVNISDVPIEMAGVQLVAVEIEGSTEGLEFQFGSQTLGPGEHLVVVQNREAFTSRYGTDVNIAKGNDGQGGLPGEFANRLGNGGETLTVVDPSDNLIQQFHYDDGSAWPFRADGAGSSLEFADPNGNFTLPQNWRSSREFGGSPGQAGQGGSSPIVINEILANSDAPAIDQVELLNTSDVDVDISNWYLSDSRDDPLKHRIADATISAGGFLVLNETLLGFGFKGQEADDVYLIEADAEGRPTSFADAARFEATPTNVSLGRWPDGTGPLWRMQQQTFGQPNSRPVGGLPGDFDQNGTVDGDDLHRLCLGIRGQIQQDGMDLNESGSLDQRDLEVMVQDILKISFGDANFDGRFNSSDLVQVFRAGEYEDDIAGNSTWATGDWYCDGDFNTTDLVQAFQWSQYTNEGVAHEPNAAARTAAALNDARRTDNATSSEETKQHAATVPAERPAGHLDVLAVDSLFDSDIC